MAKKQATPKFQDIVKHIPEIDKVRTDIRVHCETEPLLKEFFEKIQLANSEFDKTFESELKILQDPKKRRKQRLSENMLKTLVFTHLSLLLNHANLDNFQQTVNTEQFHQQEILNFIEAHPEVAKANLSFSKKLSPESAMDFMKNLNQHNEDDTSKLQELVKQHNENVEYFLSRYSEIAKQLSEKLKAQNIVLSEEQIHQVLRILGGMV